MAKSGKTENLRPWQPGQSGNPAGKAKGTRNRSTIIREWLEVPSTDGDGQIVDQMVRALIQRAMKGDVAAFRELMDSGYGKVADKSEGQVIYTMMGTVTRNGVPLEFDVGERV